MGSVPMNVPAHTGDFEMLPRISQVYEVAATASFTGGTGKWRGFHHVRLLYVAAYDFIQEILSHGNDIEVLAPVWLRNLVKRKG